MVLTCRDILLCQLDCGLVVVRKAALVVSDVKKYYFENCGDTLGLARIVVKSSRIGIKRNCHNYR